MYRRIERRKNNCHINTKIIIMVKNIILISLLIIMGLLAFAVLVAAILDVKGKICIKLLAALFATGIITRCVANL